MKRTFIFLAVVALVGCSGEEGVRQAHIDKANQLCGPAGFVSIADAHRIAEYESCGYKCSRSTGRGTYVGIARCSDGSKVQMEFVK